MGSVDSQTAAAAMKNLVGEIARALVDETDKVVVEVLTAADSTVLRLHVAPSDIGKMIGKQGRCLLYTSSRGSSPASAVRPSAPSSLWDQPLSERQRSRVSSCCSNLLSSSEKQKSPRGSWALGGNPQRRSSSSRSVRALKDQTRTTGGAVHTAHSSRVESRAPRVNAPSQPEEH